MTARWQAIVIATLVPLFGSTGCTMATIERNFQRGSRELGRDLSRVGRKLENGFENLFASHSHRPGSYRPASYRRPVRSSSARPASSAKPSSRPSFGPAAPTTPSAPAARAEHPFATPVPGRTGFVKLPGRADLPEVDVRGIAPGTSIEVPSAGGGSIGFRVP